MRTLVTVVSTLVVAIVPTQKTSQPRPIVLDVDFCHVAVAEPYLTGNASFTAEYGFTVTAAKPEGIRVLVRGLGIDDNSIALCISRWRLNGVEGGFRTGFRWKHGVGWEYMHISGGGLNIRIAASGVSPY